MHKNIATEISYQKRMRQTGMQYNVLQVKMASGMLHSNYLSADRMPEKGKVYIIELIIKVFLFEIKVYFFLHARPWIPGDEIAIFTAVIH